MIEGRLPVIGDIVAQLVELSAQLPNTGRTAGIYDLFIERWHFTSYERIRLQFLLNRWNVLVPGEYPLDTLPPGLNNGARVLTYLEKKLDSLCMDYSPVTGLVDGQEIPN